MSQFFSQYFDFNFMFNHIDQVWAGFRTTLLLWVVAGFFALIWGLILSVLRQTPGRLGLIVRLPTIAYIDAFRGIPLLMVIILIYGGVGGLASSNPPPGPIPAAIAAPPWLRQPPPLPPRPAELVLHI